MDTPDAPQRDHIRSIHDDPVSDPWFWLRDRDDPAVVAYLEQENAYTARVMAPTEPLQRAIFDEIKRRTQETDLTVPARRGEYWYSTRTVEGKPYRIWVRMSGSPSGAEQVLLDENAEAEGHAYFRSANVAVSPDDRLLAYSVDTSGGERYVTRFREIDTGRDLDDEILVSYYGAAWSSDSKHLFYTVPDDLMRPYQVWRHRLGTHPGDDALVYEEPDEHFFLGVRRSRSGDYIMISAGSATTSDCRVIPADDPLAGPTTVLPRSHGVEYSADHRGGDFWVVTNEDALDGRLIKVPVGGGPGVEVVAHIPAVKLTSVTCFASHVVVWGRRDGLSAVMIVGDNGEAAWLDMGEDVYHVYPDANLEFETDTLRYGFQSFVTPPSVFDHDVRSGERTLLKETPVLGDYDRTELIATREWAEARDGVRIPVSLVRHRDTPRDGTTPILVYAYGAYEISMDPWFSIPRLGLLERGVVFAIAHVRGGGELGKAWYEDGKMAHKTNTFFDLIDVVDHLVAAGHGARDRVAIRGGSAGGLTVGASLRFGADRFRAAVAEVPFVDVVNTMLDEDLPLTVTEREEWGDPGDAQQYRWLKSYAPYEDLGPVAEYPALLVTAGLNDPRVSYWEPAKWVAKMRTQDAGRHTLLLKTEMGAGHFARSGRYEQWEDEAFVLAFILSALGVAD